MGADVKPTMRETHNSALDALRPDRFEFHERHHGWVKEFPSVGQVAFASLAWPHAQSPSFDDSSGDREATNALGLLVMLQQSVWGFPPAEAVPVNILAILEDTGGAVIAAYDRETGFNSEGWLGFAIGMGTRSGVLYSHMLGVREDVRGIADLGWYLKLLQGYLAIRSGHHAMTWTFDPLRGANARLNLEKLGARMINLTIDKYGVMRSSLYGDVPTDRFTAFWDLLDPATHDRMHRVYDRRYHPLTLDDIATIPEATVESLPGLRLARPASVRYRIPGDVDALMRQRPDEAIKWRQQMREVLGGLMTLRRARIDEGLAGEGPIAVDTGIEGGPYVATGFATGYRPGEEERTSYYILTRESTS